MQSSHEFFFRDIYFRKKIENKNVKKAQNRGFSRLLAGNSTIKRDFQEESKK